MKRQAQELLAKINGKVAEVKNLVAQDKLTEAKEARAELERMQAKYNLIKDLDDDAADAAAQAAAAGSATAVNGRKPEMKDKIKAFVNVLTAGVKKTQAAA